MALQVLKSAPSTWTIGAATLDFAFDIAFHEVSVLIARLQVQKSESDTHALVLKLREAKTLGQRPVSKNMIDGAGMIGADPVAERQEKMKLIEGLLNEFAQ